MTATKTETKAKRKKKKKEEEIIEVEVPVTAEVKAEYPIDICPLPDGKLRVGDRWTIDPANGGAILLSKEFEESIMSYTYATDDEWGGFVVGHDIHYFNPEKKKICRLLICERAIVLGQTRSGGSFEILEEIINKWMDDDDYVEEQRFMEVYGIKKWTKIGWVHSHVDMGVFWSPTDTTTTEDMDMPGILSIVVSRIKAEKKLKRLIRVDKSEIWFGGSYRVFKDEVKNRFVYSEVEVETLDAVPKDIRKKYKKILDETVVIETKTHTSGTTVVHTSQQTGYYRGGVWQGYGLGWDDVYSGYSAAAAIKEKFAKQYASRTGNRRTLTIPDFFMVLDEGFADMVYPNGTKKKWKMQLLVRVMETKDILKAYEVLIKQALHIQLCLKNYNNFVTHVKNFHNNVVSLAAQQEDHELARAILKCFGKGWVKALASNLVERDDIATKWLTKPTAVITDWEDLFLQLPDKTRSDIIDTIIYTADDKIQKKVLDKFGDSLEWLVRGEYEEHAMYIATLYENFVSGIKKVKGKKNKALYRATYLSFMNDAFKNYFLDHNADELQHLINALDDEYVGLFVKDFIAEFESEKDLVELFKAGKIKVYMKQYSCPHCKNVWPTQDDADKCIEQCKVLLDKAAAKAKIIEAKEIKIAEAAVEKKTVATTKDASVESDITSSYYDDVTHIYGVPVKYFKQPNVCNLCGAEYTEAAHASNCETECVSLLAAIMDYAMATDYMYECPCCGMYLDHTEFIDRHFGECPQYGALYASHIAQESKYQQTGNTQSKITITASEVIRMLAGRYERLEHNPRPPPFIRWLVLKEKEKEFPSNVYQCKYCDVTRQHIEKYWLDAAKACYKHETNCCRVKQLVDKRDSLYRCLICKKLSANMPGLIIDHLLTAHQIKITDEELKDMVNEPNRFGYTLGGDSSVVFCGLCDTGFDTIYILREHLIEQHDITLGVSALASLIEVIEVKEVKMPVAQEETDNARLINGTLTCKHCEVVISNSSVMMQHLRIKHKLFADAIELNKWDKHIRKHKVDVIDSVPLVYQYANMFYCNMCGEFSCSHLTDMIGHFRTAHALSVTAGSLGKEMSKMAIPEISSNKESTAYIQFLNSKEKGGHDSHLACMHCGKAFNRWLGSDTLNFIEWFKHDTTCIEEQIKDGTDGVTTGPFPTLESVDEEATFDIWRAVKAIRGEDAMQCHYCQRTFMKWACNRYNVIECFLHEVQEGFDVDDFSCTYCSMICGSIEDRVECEQSHEDDINDEQEDIKDERGI